MMNLLRQKKNDLLLYVSKETNVKSNVKASLLTEAVQYVVYMLQLLLATEMWLNCKSF